MSSHAIVLLLEASITVGTKFPLASASQLSRNSRALRLQDLHSRSSCKQTHTKYDSREGCEYFIGKNVHNQSIQCIIYINMIIFYQYNEFLGNIEFWLSENDWPTPYNVNDME